MDILEEASFDSLDPILRTTGTSAERHRPDVDGHTVIDLRERELAIELDTDDADTYGRIHLTPHAGLLGASRLELFAKRALDILGASIALVLLTPVCLVIAAAIKLTSPGPVLYRQTRVGRNGVEFSFLKFRSMRVGAEAEKADLLEQNEVAGPVFKMKHDPRMTSVGRLLRKASLDEVPQLLHVLSGHMSLVGFRPPLPEEVALYDDFQRQRLLVKPGLTCIWQVSGRSDLDFDTWIRMDLEYIAGWSLGLDARLLMKTFGAVVSGRGAY